MESNSLRIAIGAFSLCASFFGYMTVQAVGISAADHSRRQAVAHFLANSYVGCTFFSALLCITVLWAIIRPPKKLSLLDLLVVLPPVLLWTAPRFL